MNSQETTIRPPDSAGVEQLAVPPLREGASNQVDLIVLCCS